MRTPEEYMELAERYGELKRRTTLDRFARHQCEVLERSYYTLAASAKLLSQSKNMEQKK